MNQLMSKLKRGLVSFRGRLLCLVIVGVVALALLTSITTALVISRGAEVEIKAEGKHVIGNLASQSMLALLYGSPENAVKPLQAIMGFPYVDRGGIFDLSGKALVEAGQSPPSSWSKYRLSSLDEPAMFQETTDAWHFIAPVVVGERSSKGQTEAVSLHLEDSGSELIGHVYVGINKFNMRKMQANIFFYTIGIGLSFALILVLLLNAALKRLTQPIYQLSNFMQKAGKDSLHVRADIDGPKEISHMADVFNRLMVGLSEQDKKLREHQSLLQTEVAIRTQELVLARDAAVTASRHKSEFLANMSHELRTPLQAIIGFADVVKEELEVVGMDQQSEELERVIQNGQRLLGLINGILDLAKIEAGGIGLRLQEVHIQSLIEEACDTISPIMRENRNRLEKKIDSDQVVLIDRDKLFQVVLNLLSNAAKFTKEGRVTLSFNPGPKLLSIEVEDTGIGLTAEEKKYIFDAFRQVDGSATRSFEGTGLGLAISKRFCELMGGTIEVDSRIGMGSTFTLKIPLPVRQIPGQQRTGVENEALARMNELNSNSSETKEPPKRVLLIDDDQEFISSQVKLLRDSGYLVFVAQSGEEALGLARSVDPNVITLDIMLPDIDGGNMLRRLKSDPKLGHIPVIIVSDAEVPDQGAGFGVEDYMTKPVRQREFFSALEKVCKLAGQVNQGDLS